MPGEEITLRGKRVPDAADVIIIMQHAPCNKRIHMKLKDTIDDLEKALRAKGTLRESHSFIQHVSVLNSQSVLRNDVTSYALAR